jgi:hypothetical protein
MKRQRREIEYNCINCAHRWKSIVDDPCNTCKAGVCKGSNWTMVDNISFEGM